MSVVVIEYTNILTKTRGCTIFPAVILLSNTLLEKSEEI